MLKIQFVAIDFSEIKYRSIGGESTLNVKRCKLFSSLFIFHEKTHLDFYLLTPAHHPCFITYSKGSQLQFYDHMRNIMVIMYVRILRIRLKLLVSKTRVSFR